MNIKKIEKEFEKMIDRHLYTMADYSISSKKIDNEILATTGEEIKEEIWQFIRQTIKQVVESVPVKGYVIVSKAFKERCDFENGYNQHVQEVKEWKEKILEELEEE